MATQTVPGTPFRYPDSDELLKETNVHIQRLAEDVRTFLASRAWDAQPAGGLTLPAGGAFLLLTGVQVPQNYRLTLDLNVRVTQINASGVGASRVFLEFSTNNGATWAAVESAAAVYAATSHAAYAHEVVTQVTYELPLPAAARNLLFRVRGVSLYGSCRLDWVRLVARNDYRA